MQRTSTPSIFTSPRTGNSSGSGGQALGSTVAEYVELSESIVATKTRHKDGAAFSGGEVRIKIEVEAPKCLLARLHDSTETMRLIQYLHAVAQSAPQWGKVEVVFVPYLPYARQDRKTDDGTHCAVAVLAALFATTGVKRFVSLDVHSPASSAAFSAAGLTLENWPSTPYLKSFLTTLQARGLADISQLCVVAPDKGAKARAGLEAAALSTAERTVDVIHCDKVRRLADGVITGIKVVEDDSPKALAPGTTLILVDDICDGGATFIGAAEALLATYPNLKSECSLHLWVTHGIFARGIEPILKGGYDTVGCTDSFQNGVTHEKLIAVPLASPA